MHTLISKSTIDQVYETARIEEVIGDFVQLKKAGSNFKALSPFTDERTPSFMVSPVKQIWKDFSSGKGGNVVAFLMEHEHYSYPEAIRYLARKYNIEIEETQQTDAQREIADEKESLFIISEFAQQHFEKNLWDTKKGKAIGLTYFKERGFRPETIRKFGLGYSLDEWEHFTKAAREAGYSMDVMEKSGLTIHKERTQSSASRSFDRFKGRVMFPIHSMSGRVLGFGGRILGQDKKAAKYMNSPESPIYHKSKVLYGIFHAKQAIAKADTCYLVEGYTDVIQMHQLGIENVVASSGTALTPEQIRLIRRLTTNITVLFDGDAAGLQAALRGIDLILEQGLNVKVCAFPEGEDPDSFAKSNALEDMVLFLQEKATDFIRFKTDVLMREDGNDPIRRAETIRDIVSSIARIPDRIKKEIYVQECSRLMGVSEDVLFNTLAQISSKLRQDHARTLRQETKHFEVIKPAPQPTEKVDTQYELERKIIEMLLLYGEKEEAFEDYVYKENESGELKLEREQVEAKVYEKIYLDLQEDEIELTHDQFRTIYYKLIEELNEREHFTLGSFLNQLDQDLVTEVSSILMEDEKYNLHQWERKNIYPKEKEHNVSQLVSETILSLRCFLIKKRIDALREATENVEEDHREVMEEIIRYLELNQLLNRKLNRVLS